MRAARGNGVGFVEGRAHVLSAMYISRRIGSNVSHPLVTTSDDDRMGQRYSPEQPAFRQSPGEQWALWIFGAPPRFAKVSACVSKGSCN